MKDGFIKVACATPKVKVADPAYNAEEIIKIIKETGTNGASLLVFSELTVSGYTCGDLFLQEPLLDACKKQLINITKATKGENMLVVVGCPLVIRHKLYNCAVVMHDGEILGVVPKTLFQIIQNFMNYVILRLERIWMN
jgi:NAD+ synthase (glutamine-hydrolysing)